ncbi:hypothetical protein Q5752_004626 [Cryptotrichosporon argae]
MPAPPATPLFPRLAMAPPLDDVDDSFLPATLSFTDDFPEPTPRRSRDIARRNVAVAPQRRVDKVELTRGVDDSLEQEIIIALGQLQADGGKSPRVSSLPLLSARPVPTMRIFQFQPRATPGQAHVRTIIQSTPGPSRAHRKHDFQPTLLALDDPLANLGITPIKPVMRRGAPQGMETIVDVEVDDSVNITAGKTIGARDEAPLRQAASEAATLRVGTMPLPIDTGLVPALALATVAARSSSAISASNSAGPSRSPSLALPKLPMAETAPVAVDYVIAQDPASSRALSPPASSAAEHYHDDDADASKRLSTSGRVLSFLSSLLGRSQTAETSAKAVIPSSNNGHQAGVDIPLANPDQAIPSAQPPLDTKPRQAPVARRLAVPSLTRPVAASFAAGKPRQAAAVNVPARSSNSEQTAKAAPNVKPESGARPGGPSGRPVATRLTRPVLVRPAPARATPIQARRVTSSTFASTALARLPPPGKGSSSSAAPVTIRDAERARDFAVRRAVFDRLPSDRGEGAATMPARRPAPPSLRTERTVPVAGRTPGKASRARALARAEFEKGLRDREEVRDKRRREVEQVRDAVEREDVKRRRKETVVWAAPLPDMYAR